ncbi:MAG: hypothetical protein K8W52_32115, partial [Deltaproteobacteria bacterium]|nr:hypothetical protein [Deltaproteobacteria bacterium]
MPAASLKADTVKPGKPLDLDDLDLAPHSQAGPLPTAPTPRTTPGPAPAPAPARAVPALELPETGGDPFGGLDLPLPSAGKPPVGEVPPPSGVVSFKPAEKASSAGLAPPGLANPGLDLDLESASARQRSA